MLKIIRHVQLVSPSMGVNEIIDLQRRYLDQSGQGTLEDEATHRQRAKAGGDVSVCA
jgi:hypothetical protein